MTRTARRGIFVLATLASFPGCPSSTTPGGNTVPIEDYVAAAAQADCDFFARCGLTDSYGPLLFRSTITDCPAQLREWLDTNAFAQLQHAVAAGTVVYHADRARACFDSFADASCAGFGASASTSSACLGVFEGTVPTGGACTTLTECAHGATCTGASGTTCGTCAPVAQLGEACGTGSGTPSCSIGDVCVHGTCAEPSTAGEACDTTIANHCQFGLSCVAATGSTTGTCTVPTPGAEGASCSLVSSCAPGLVCGTVTGATTTACRRPRTDGTCQPVYLGASDCAAGMTCSVPSGMTDGTCVPIPTLGQPCTQVCVAPARCVSGTCVATRHVGESCASGDECLSGHCDAGVCTTQAICTP